MPWLKDIGYKEKPVKFNEGNHSYYLDGKRMKGVTSVIGVKDKDWKGLWMTKMMKKYILENIDLEKKYNVTELTALLNEGRNAYNIRSDRAKDDGSEGHHLIEESIMSGKRYKLEDLIYDDKYFQYKVRNIYGNWLEWEKQHKIEYVAIEVVVCDDDPSVWVAGTIDCIAYVDGILAVIDWKSSKQFSEDLCLQTAMYGNMLKLGGVTEPFVRRGVRLDKGISRETEEPIKDYVPLYDKSNDIIIPTDYNKDLSGFMALVGVSRWLSYIDKDHKKKAPYGNYKVLTF